MKIKTITIILLISLLLISPIAAKEITSKVDDKKIIHAHGDGSYFIHTIDFGDVEVTESEYQEVFINDTVTFNTHSEWGYYAILKINGTEVQNNAGL